MYHQNGQQVDDENQRIKNFLGESLNYIQIGNGYSEIDIKIRKPDITNIIKAADNTNEVIRLVKNAFAYTIHDARISTSSGTENEQNNLVGPVSTFM